MGRDRAADVRAVRFGAAIAVALAAVFSAGCGDRSQAPATVTATPSETGAYPGGVTESDAPRSGDQQSGADEDAGGYRAKLVPRGGTSGATTYEVKLPQLSGGIAAVTERFNSSMEASLRDQLGLPNSKVKLSVHDGALIGENRSRVTHIGPGVVAGVLVTNRYFEGAAHPSNQVGTVVIATESAQPVLLTEVFRDPDAGLATLARLVRERPGPGGTAPWVSDPARDLANWVPSPDGLTVYAPVSPPAGDWFPVTIPWSELKDLVAPGMWSALTS